jgi:flagellar biosynthetic protein FlhB
MSEKKHIATDRRRQKAKAEGRVVKSNDLTSAALLVIALVVLLVFGESLFSKLASWLKESLVSVSVVSRDNIYWVDRFGDGVARYLLFVLPLLGAMFIAVVLVHLLQTGLPLSLSRVKPDAKKLSLSAGLVRLFSIESLFRLVMASFKIRSSAENRRIGCPAKANLCRDGFNTVRVCHRDLPAGFFWSTWAWCCGLFPAALEV